MGKISDWEAYIGRRLKLRDLHVFFVVARAGSMSKAAANLNVSPPAVSQIIADLEHALGVKLFDRSAQGVEPTTYGRALLKGGAVAFDELKQTIKEIEFLADPTVGDVKIGCPETIAAILPPIIHNLYQRHPGIVVHVSEQIALTLDMPQIRDRSLDLAIVRLTHTQVADHLNVEALFTDEAVVAVPADSPWATQRHQIKLADLAHATWVLPPGTSMNCTIIRTAFREAGLHPPKISLVTFSVVLRAMILSHGSYATVLPKSTMLLCGERLGLKILPIKLPGVQDWPVVIITLKDRTINPVARLFIDHVRAEVKALVPSLR